MKRRRALVSLAVAAVGATGLAVLAGCPSTSTTTLYTPVTGILIDAQSLTQGLGCGTDPGQVYRYAAVVTMASVTAQPPGLPVSGVFDCYTDGQFSNLPTLDGGTTSYAVAIYAYDYASFPGTVPLPEAGAPEAAPISDAEADSDAGADSEAGAGSGADADSGAGAEAGADSEADAVADSAADAAPEASPLPEAAPPPAGSLFGPCNYLPADAACPGENPAVVASYEGLATWTTTCVADQIQGVSEVATCKPLVSTLDGGVEAGSTGPSDGAVPTISVATQGFAAAEGGAYQCQIDYDTVRAGYSAPDASGFITQLACPTPLVISPAVPGASYSITATLLAKDRPLANARCGAVASDAGAPVTATCAAATPAP